MSDVVKEILRAISSSLQIPTIIILILLILLTILMLGSFVAEILTERKSLKMNIPELVDQLQGKNTTQMKEAVEKSSLLNRQKDAARELINRVTYPDDTREALARQLIADEEIRYGRITKITDLTSRVAPMFGLMGTLIPLGPGLIALGQGDTSTLSSSLLIAFDTTVAGLISGAISYIISGIRKNWYEEYMIGLETIMETILDVQSVEREKVLKQVNGNLDDLLPDDVKAKKAAEADAKAKEAAGQKPGMPGQAGQPGVRPAVPGQPTVPGQGRPGMPGQPMQPGAARPGMPGQGQAHPAGMPGQGRPGMPGQPAQPGQAQPAGMPGQARPGMPAQPGQAQPAGMPGQAQGYPRTTQQGMPQGGFSRATQQGQVSPTDQTMVQKSFHDEVRAAEEALKAGKPAPGGVYAGLRRP